MAWLFETAVTLATGTKTAAQPATSLLLCAIEAIDLAMASPNSLDSDKEIQRHNS